MSKTKSPRDEVRASEEAARVARAHQDDIRTEARKRVEEAGHLHPPRRFDSVPPADLDVRALTQLGVKK